MTKKISVIGCGWLGLPLAKSLVADSFFVKGSTTSKDKLAVLKSFGIKPHLVKLTEDGLEGTIEDCLSGSKTLIINIPPGLRKHPDNDFVKQMRFLIAYIEKSSIEKVLFVSSTSVYGDDTTLRTVTEDSIQNPDSEAGKQLVAVEALLQKNSHFKTTILRFSGLYGEDRHPAKYLSKKIVIENPEAPVNLIHLDDCIGIIKTILQKDVWNATFNASSLPHPTRSAYYTAVCKARHLPVPVFDNASQSKGKYIDSSKLIRLLNYQFQIRTE